MDLSALGPYAPGLLVLFARLGSFFMIMPFFGDEGMSGRIRIFLAFGVSIALYGLITPGFGTLPQGEVQLALLLFKEMIVGLAIGGLIRLMFWAIVIAGSMLSLQMGLTSAVINDPSMGGQVPVLGRFVALAALLLCLSLNLHHMWLEALVHSYKAFPVGHLPAAGELAELAISTVSQSFKLAVSLSLPLIIFAIVFNAGLGLAARVTPQIQIFFIAQPLTISLGLFIVAACVGAITMGFADAMVDFQKQLG